MVKYSRKYSEIEFTLKHKRYCDKHGINPDEANLEEINQALVEANLKRCREKSKEYYETHHDQMIEAMRKHKLEKRDEILEKKQLYSQIKCICECGCEVVRNNLSTHKKTQKHLMLMEETKGVISDMIL